MPIPFGRRSRSPHRRPLCVAPPSLHPNGKRYEYLRDDGLSEPLFPLPEALYDFAAQKQKFEDGELKATRQPIAPFEIKTPPVEDPVARAELAYLAALSANDFDTASGGGGILPDIADEHAVRLVATMLAVKPKPEHHDDLVNPAFELGHYFGGTEFEEQGWHLFLEDWYRGSPKANGEDNASIESDAKIRALWDDGVAKKLRGLPGLRAIGSLIKEVTKLGWTPEEAEKTIARQNLDEVKTAMEASGAAPGVIAKLDAVTSYLAPMDFGKKPEEPVEIKGQVFVWRDPKNDPPRPFLGKDKHHCRGYLGATIGRTGDGKTSAELVEMVGFASGLDLLNGGAPHRCGPITVWYWNLEDPLIEIEKRVQAIVLHYKLDPRALGNRMIINSGRDRNLIVAKRKNGEVMLTPNVEALKREMKRLNVSILALDPFIKTHLLDENKSELDFAVNAFAGIASDCNAAVDLCHHIRKGLRGEASVMSDDDARGSSTLISAVRAARMVIKMTADEGKKFGLEPDDHGNFFRIDRATANMVCHQALPVVPVPLRSVRQRHGGIPRGQRGGGRSLDASGPEGRITAGRRGQNTEQA